MIRIKNRMFTTEAQRTQRDYFFSLASEREASEKISTALPQVGCCFSSSQGKATKKKPLCPLCLCGEKLFGHY
jgi:hypothetical protein